jgi:serine/threonine-protein kinase HipA
MRNPIQLDIEVCADWLGLPKPVRAGVLHVSASRGKEVFSFNYDPDWLNSENARQLDPSLGLFAGRQFSSVDRQNFGVFLDSSPDRWGRVLMQRREAQLARKEGRDPRGLLDSDYLLGVYDGFRMGALRFRIDPDGPFLDDNEDHASPPWTSLRELEEACLGIERDDSGRAPNYDRWLRMLISPGASLGGARPKAAVVDEQGRQWIAKFPSIRDEFDQGAWEYVVHQLATDAKITVPPASSRSFGGVHHTFLTRRFDRADGGQRLHFASAMTLLQHQDGDDALAGASYLEMVEFLAGHGAQPERDLQELWRRIVFSMYVSNVDDHLRNHGFLLGSDGWSLSPAFDINPDPDGDGLRLNVSDDDNAQDLALARRVAKHFRVSDADADRSISSIGDAVRNWRRAADATAISASEQSRMSRAFRLADMPARLA